MLVALCTLIFIHFCALITPGPDFFLVSQTAISRSRKDAVLVALGICLGAMVWSLLALMGLNIIFEKMACLKQGLLIAGGLYLCWLGYQMLRSAFSKGEQTVKQMVLPKSPYLFFYERFIDELIKSKSGHLFWQCILIISCKPIV